MIENHDAEGEGVKDIEELEFLEVIISGKVE